MSTVFSKNKEKRSRSSSNEANNSFVKNVTSRVSGLLPATITKWFSSPSSSNANGSTPAADVTDSSTEDEATESPITTQPPPKRMRYSSPGKFNHFGANDSNCVPTNIDTIEQCTPYSTIQSPPGRTTFRRETNYVSTPIRASSEDTIIERDSTKFNKTQHSVSNVGASVATKRKSLFDTPYNREASMRALKTTASNTRVDPKAPRFKPSLLGSPFYPGQTMYGGASTSMYINQPNIKQRKVAQVKESDSSDNTAMSHSARRVMDLLENYSSPLMEARRISQIIKNSSSSSQNDTLNSSTVSGSPYTNKVLSYKTQELHVPNIASILRLKQRSRLMDTTNAARQIIASHSSTSEYFSQPYPTINNSQKEHTETETSSKFTTKMKNKLTRPKRGESIDLEEQTVIPVNLPTAVLQIDKDNLPKFTFGIPAHKPASNPTPKFTILGTTNMADKPAATAKTGTGDLCKPATISNNDLYKFSSPVRITSDQTNISTTPPKFTFGSPERGIDKATDNKKDDNPSYVVGQPKVTEKLPIPKSADWKCPDCWVANNPDANNCVCCGAKQPSKEAAKPPKCTICQLADSQANSEKCVNCEKVQLNNNTKITVLSDSSKWKCQDCWVNNDDSADKCLCCGGKNPKKASSTSSVPVASADSEWKCEICWIKNKSSVDVCAACGGARPGNKSKDAPSLPAQDFGSSLFRTDNSLKNIAKTQSDKWECTSCLVRNEKNRTKCVCCDEDKPGTTKALDNKKSFNFGSVTATSFKFGIDPKDQNTSATKPLEVKVVDGSSKPEESETNNNVYKNSANSSSPTVFGAFAKKPEDQTDAATEKKLETPKFTFGIPKTQASSEPATIPIFGAPKKSSESILEKTREKKENLQEVPKIDFKMPTTKESPKPLPSAFTMPVISQVNQEKPANLLPSLINPLASNVSTENKESAGNNVSIIPQATSSASLPQQSSFTFTGIGLKPSLDLFAAPASTVPAFSASISCPPTTSTMSLFQKPEPAPASSMFQNPNPTTSTVSLFQKTELASTAAPPSLAATAPIFSFGANTAPNPAPQPEKPKFNFSFSNNTPIFNNNNTFSATPDNSNGNKFGIPGGSGNGLSGANQMAGGNGLGSGKLGGHEMAANSLSTGNEMSSESNMFGVPAQKENMWSSNSSSNLFVSNAATNTLQKPPTFSFGASTPFNPNNPASTFGANVSATQNAPPPAFGANPAAAQNNPAPAFGSNPAPTQNMFGINQNANPQTSMFSSPVQSQPAQSLFGSAQPASNPAPAMNLFGTPNVGATPTFGTPNASIPTFEAPSLTPAPAPAFNFGAPQQHATAVFGFGQQPQSQQPQQTGVYSFGAAPGGAPQVQFNMGSAPNTAVRRVRKAFRRNPQR